MYTFLRTFWAICWKDIRVWLRHPTYIFVTFAPPLMLLMVEALGAQAVGHSPVALVQQDHGPAGIQMAQIIHQAGIFRLHDLDAQQAEIELKNLDVIAIVTIPPDFTQRIQSHEASPIDVKVDNLNLDFTNDVRRSVPDMITQFYHAQGDASPIKVTTSEQTLRSRDVELFEYSVLPTIIFLLMIGGLVSGSLTTASEWESRTVKELLLSPISRGAIIGGKVLASFLTTFGFGLLVLGIGYLAGWIQPQGIYWGSAIFILMLISLFSATLGITVGLIVRRVQPVGPLSINVGMYLFFLAGGIGVLSFEPDVLQNIAAYIPLTYGRHALEMAVFYSSSELLGRDVLILAVSILVALALSLLAMRRGMVSQ